MNKSLVYLGILLIFLGLSWDIWAHLGFGKLPGDIYINTGKIQVYFPITSSLVMSILLSIFFKWIYQP